MEKDAKIRVLQLGGAGGLYGAERWILALIRNHDANKIESEVCVIRDDPALDPQLPALAEQYGYTSHVIDSFGRLSWSAIAQLRRIIVEQKIDIVHSHGYKNDLIAILAARGTTARLLATPHGWSANAGIKLAAYEALDRFLFRFFDAVAPLSQGLLDGLKGRRALVGKLHLIPNGVDIREIEETQGVAPLLTAMKANGGYIVGYIGQLIVRKGLDSLLRAFAGWQRPGKQLVLVGEGDQRAALEALAQELGISDHVHFAGFRADRLAWLGGFDVFVLPSWLEGIPRCLMEAMAVGVPIISSDIDGSRELLAHGEVGLLFPPGDVAALRAKLEQLDEPQVAQALCTKAKLHLHEHYSAKRMASEYEQLFAEILSRPRC